MKGIRIGVVAMIIVVLMLSVPVISAVESDGDAFWPMAKVDKYNTSTVNAPYTPISEVDESQVKTFKIGDGWASTCYPICVGDYTYVCGFTMNENEKIFHLYKLDSRSNIVLDKIITPGFLEKGGYTGWLCYTDEGYIIVPSGSGIISAYRADDLEFVWTNDEIKVQGLQASNPIMYHEGYIYTAGFQGSSGGFKGPLSCHDVKDGSLVWKIDETTNGGKYANFGMYWGGVAVVDNWLLVPTEIGVVLSVDISKSIEQKACVVNDEVYPCGQDEEEIILIRDSVVYNEELGVIYINQQSNDYRGYVFAIGFDKNTGKFDQNDVNKDGVIDENDFTNYYAKQWGRRVSVTFYKERVYVPCMTLENALTSGGILVLDSKTLEWKYEIVTTDNEIFMKNPSWYHLTINTHYATAENDYKIYVYTFPYDSPGYVAMFEANQKSVDGELVCIYAVPQEYAQYATSNVTIGPQGNLYFLNDSANLFTILAPEHSSDDNTTTTIVIVAIVAIALAAVAGYMYWRKTNA